MVIFEVCAANSVLYLSGVKFKSTISYFERGKAKIITTQYDLPDLRGSEMRDLRFASTGMEGYTLNISRIVLIGQISADFEKCRFAKV